MQYRIPTLILLLVSLGGCHFDKTTFTTAPAVDNSAPVSLISVQVSPQTVTAYKNQPFTAVARFSDGSEDDVTDEVEWQSSDVAVADINSSGLATLNGAGSVAVSAILNGVESNTAAMTVVSSVVCGHAYGDAYSTAVNDVDATNATGACLKVAQDSFGNWYTSAPSKAAAEALNVKPILAIYYESGTNGPTGVFVRLNWFQIESLCKTLRDIEFAGRSDWTMPDLTQISGLFSDLGNMFTGYGWPTYQRYFTSSPNTPGEFDYVSLNGSATDDIYPSYETYGSCVSTSG
ncbi:Ig-like domain-containing protein [Enterovibrio paralichthyis]|uniref:Ig-like domain-containing protein n=1 Tax=Enterovibrio paralichthyis TaxID=2853805 RepID=UPI001C43CC86|nr:Ig-like domain-containing protein [Enterovibrio paralichthyis]MBV7296733.1 Ig-like domain-containing protein [Enterovibrio paralichthyis]